MKKKYKLIYYGSMVLIGIILLIIGAIYLTKDELFNLSFEDLFMWIFFGFTGVILVYKGLYDVYVKED